MPKGLFMAGRRAFLITAGGAIVGVAGCTENSSPRQRGNRENTTAQENESINQEFGSETNGSDGYSDNDEQTDSSVPEYRRELISAVQALEPSREFFTKLLTNHLSPSSLIAADLDRDTVQESLMSATEHVSAAIEVHPENYQSVHDALLTTIDYHAQLFDYFSFCQQQMATIDSIDFFAVNDYSGHRRHLESTLTSLDTGTDRYQELEGLFREIDPEVLPSPRTFEQGRLVDHVSVTPFEWQYLITIYRLDIELLEIAQQRREISAEQSDEVAALEEMATTLSDLADQYQTLATNDVPRLIESSPIEKQQAAICLRERVENGGSRDTQGNCFGT